ncbi:MAG: rep [Streptosporangiaceae bacterium]|nr:rep [Streptosporangiaceae bacterium]
MTATEETGPAGGLGDEILAYLDGVEPDEALPPAPPQDVLTRHALRVAVKELRLSDAKGNRDTARELAHEDFAAVRMRGRPQQEVLLPDDTKVGLISIKQGSTTYAVDENELLLLVATTVPSELEDFVAARALNDPRVLEVLLREVPDVVERRIRPKYRKELGDEIEERGGYVANQKNGDLVKVARVTRHKPTGEFTYKSDKDKLSALRTALDAGLITEDGEIAAQIQPAAPVPAAEEEPAARPAPAAPAGAPALTPEQVAIGDSFDAGDSTIVEARAGSGKTFTLKTVGQRIKGRGLYAVYNAANAKEARGKFPRNVRVSTAHGVAKAAVGRPYQARLDTASHQPAKQVASILGIDRPVILAGTKIAPAVLARIVMQTLKGWCLSADPEATIAHMPGSAGLEAEPVQQELASVVLPFVRKAWADIKATDGVLKFEHDYYLKMWGLSRPTLPYDVILWDEVQDADRVVLDVMTRQDHAQIMPVGDPFQAIYGWRGAVNAMDHFPSATRLALSQSFRFGPAIATQANKWLNLLGADPLVRGYERISSVIRPLDVPDAVLCRTNAEATAQAMRFLEAGHDTAIVGGGDPIRRLAEAALELREGRGTAHPELFAFQTWGEVVDYAENDPGGSDLAVFVRLIDQHSPEAIIAMTGKLSDVNRAEVTVCTMHKSKGLEWNSVLIGNDFHPPKRDPEHPERPALPDDLLMLGYVAVTRARLSLDVTNVAWLDDFVPAAVSA